MHVWLVTPAWGREHVTELVLAQRAWLRDVLAPAGVSLHCVVVCDDGNLDVAVRHGFDTIEMSNKLGAKVNAGFEHARQCGADWVCFIGSDDWMHPSLFDELTGAGVIANRIICQVDLARGMLKAVGCFGKTGGIPWFIRPGALPKAPLPAGQMRGIDLHLALMLRRARWTIREGMVGGLVDFKTDNNMTPYGAGSPLHDGEVPAFHALREWYPDELVDKAEALCG